MIHAYYEIGLRGGWCHQHVFGTVCDMLLERYPNNFKIFDSQPLQKPNEDSTRNRYGPYCLTIVNTETNKYFLVSYMDFLKYIYINPNFDLPNCVEIFATVGGHKDITFFHPEDIPATPISNVCGHRLNESFIEECWNQPPIKKVILNKPTLIGGTYGFRRYLMNNDSRFAISIGNYEGNYIKDHLYPQKLCLSLPGGEMSNRDIEIMGLGNAGLRPKYRTTKTHNPLFANFHYIAVEHEDIPMIKGEHEKYWKELGDRIIDRWYEVKDDEEFLRFIGENGRKWYLENGTVKAAANIIYNLMDLNKLK